MSEIKERYKIGEYSFDTFHEYRNAQEDLKKIEVINEELDIHDPEVAVRLYNLIRDGEIVFKSSIGEKYFDHVADIVADKSVGLLEDKAVVDEAEHKVRYQKYIGMAVVALAAGLFVYFGFSELENYLTARRLAKLSNETRVSGKGANNPSLDDFGNINEKKEEQEEEEDPFKREELVDPSTLTILSEFETVFEQNNDLVGWITIPGTRIDYPIVQSDNSYYLDHSFDGNQDSNGTLFMDERCDYINPTTNTIIYGHNMKSGLMFGELKEYLDEEFYKEHRLIDFSTIYENKTYQVVAVCLAEVENADDTTFRYYNFIQAENMDDWNAFVNNIKKLSVYETGIELVPGDRVLTLSTCNNYTNDGRLFVVAKDISR